MKTTRDAIAVPARVASEPGLVSGLCFGNSSFYLVKRFDVRDVVIDWS